MNTSRVRSGTNALELLRALAAGDRAAPGRPAVAASSAQPTTAAHDPAVLRKRLKDAVQGVDLDDTEKSRVIRRPVLREIILWEFGDAFREHPEFSSMLDSIESTLAADAAARERFTALMRDLAADTGR